MVNALNSTTSETRMYLPRHPAEQKGEQEDQREERDVELALHRHRPDVLQRTHRLTGAKIIRSGVRQFPILEITEAGQTLVSKRLPPRFRLHQNCQHGRSGEHDDERGQQPANQSRHLGNRPQRRTRRQRGTQQTPAEEKPRQREENVDTARNTTEPDVEYRHEGDRDAAQAIEIVSVEAGLPVSGRCAR